MAGPEERTANLITDAATQTAAGDFGVHALQILSEAVHKRCVGEPERAVGRNPDVVFGMRVEGELRRTLGRHSSDVIASAKPHSRTQQLLRNQSITKARTIRHAEVTKGVKPIPSATRSYETKKPGVWRLPDTGGINAGPP